MRLKNVPRDRHELAVLTFLDVIAMYMRSEVSISEDAVPGHPFSVPKRSALKESPKSD